MNRSKNRNIYIYIYIYMCVCVCVYVYAYARTCLVFRVRVWEAAAIRGDEKAAGPLNP